MAIYSCDILENESDVYNGKTVAAFEFQQDQVEAADGTPYDYILEVQVIRPETGKLEEALNISYVVIDSLTTAVSPDDYSLVTPSPVTIQADSLRTDLVLTIDGNAIPPGDARVLTIQLVGNEDRGVEGADIIGQFKLTIVGN